MYDSVWMYVSFLLNGQTTDSIYGWMSSLATREREDSGIVNWIPFWSILGVSFKFKCVNNENVSLVLSS